MVSIATFLLGLAVEDRQPLTSQTASRATRAGATMDLTPYVIKPILDQCFGSFSFTVRLTRNSAA